MCGIIAFTGCCSDDDCGCVSQILDGLLSLQHRGQESAGVSVLSDSGKISTIKAMGLVSSLDASKLSGTRGIGHVRYSTTGSSTIENAQPFVSTDGSFAVAFNGNITNYASLKESLPGKFDTTSDCDVIIRLLEGSLKKKHGLTDALKRLCLSLEGSYSIVVLFRDGTITALRDPLGFKPLSLGKVGSGGYAFASETCALDSISASEIGDVLPGEAIVVSPDGRIERTIVAPEKRHAHCMFEFVYFARPDSVIEGRPVYLVRELLGEALASANCVNGGIVVPVPDSGRCCAAGFSCKTGIPMKEGLMKNRYIHRTFIMPLRESRERGVAKKINPIRGVLSGKEVVLIDDSIVRGTTMRKIVGAVRKAGATKVHVRISCPRIIAPCYMGIDFPTYGELAAATGDGGDGSEEEIRKNIGADTLKYNTLESLKAAIALDDLCMACLTDKYPVKVGGGQK